MYQLRNALSQGHGGSRIMSDSSLLVGIGSPYGDDRVGWDVARRVAQVLGDALPVRCLRTPADLLDLLQGIETLDICDALASDVAVGSVHCWTWPAPEIECASFIGSHDLSLPAVLALAETLGRLPALVRIWGIGVKPGVAWDSLSAAAAATVPGVVERICRVLIHA
jgi:hydrogenase maturation protease